MTLLDFVSVRIAFWLILGILIGYYGEPDILGTGIVMLFSLAILGFSKYHSSWEKVPVFGLGLALSMMTIGAFVVSLAHPGNRPAHFANKITPTNSQLQLKIREVLKPNAYSNRYVVKVLSVNRIQAMGKCVLSITRTDNTNPLQVDDEILVNSRPVPVPPPLNPNQFDYREYLKKQGIHHQIRTSDTTYILIEGASKTLIGRAANFREAIISKLRGHKFGVPQLGVIQALLLGQRNDIPEDTYSSYKNAGAVHILAVSGLHVGIVLLIFQFVLRPLDRLPKGNILKLVIIVVTLWIYAAIAGLSPSVVRAVTMFSFIAYALYLNRPTNVFNIVALSLVFLLLIHPLFLFQVGFQMSYAAVFAIVWIYPKLQGFWNPGNYILHKAWQLSSVSIAAQLGVLPLSLFYFHQFPALFFVSNLLVVPFLGIILGFGVFILALAYFEVLPKMMVYGYNEAIGGMNAIVAWVGQQEAFVFKDIPFDTVQLVLTYLFIFGLVFTLTKSKFRNLMFLLVTVTGFIGHMVVVTFTANQKERVFLAHQTRNSVLLHQDGSALNVIATDTARVEKVVTTYKIANRISTIQYDTLRNSYTLGKKRLVLLDSTGILPNTLSQPDYLLLVQSPRIHLERVIATLQPRMILADGSNYTSYVARWLKTCEEKKIPFHYTGKQGGYSFE